MESEKVKEIKIVLKGLVDDASNWLQTAMIGGVNLADILTLINELESENKRLNKSDTLKEESSIEYYNLYKDLKRKNKDLNELCELQRVSIAESFVRENQLKDRIAELEKENQKYHEVANDCQKIVFMGGVCDTKLALKQFAERLKEEIDEMKQFFDSCLDREYCGLTKDQVNETLKEFINE